MADDTLTYAGQPLGKLIDALDQSVARGALAGDRTVIADLRRELAAIKVQATSPPRPDIVFRGKKQVALEALLEGNNQREAAERAGCTTTTINRWVNHDEQFQAALQAAREQRTVQAQESMRDLLPLAVRRLRGVLLDTGASHRDVISAAREIMDRAGMPKTEVWHASIHSDSPLAQIPDNELDERIQQAEARLRLIEGGKS